MCQELILTNPLWQDLVAAGKFEERKALMSLKTTEKDIKDVRPRSFDDVFNNETATLATIRKYRGSAITDATIHSFMYFLSDSLSVGNSLTDGQVELMCEFILEDYWYLTIADLKLCIKNGIKGRYGKIYNRMDVQVVSEWLEIYTKDRVCYTLAKRKESEDYKNQTISPEVLSQIRKFRAELDQKQELKSVNRKYKPVTLYSSLEGYCKAKNLDYSEILNQLTEKWKAEFEKDVSSTASEFETFFCFKLQKFLLEESEKVENNEVKIQ